MICLVLGPFHRCTCTPPENGVVGDKVGPELGVFGAYCMSVIAPYGVVGGSGAPQPGAFAGTIAVCLPSGVGGV